MARFDPGVELLIILSCLQITKCDTVFLKIRINSSFEKLIYLKHLKELQEKVYLSIPKNFLIAM